MSTEVTLPALGESVTEGTVSRWLKEVGDTIEADEALLEVSTDKVDTEIPSPAAGTLLEIKVNEDETVDVGTVLAVIGDEGESGGDADTADADAEGADDSADESAEESTEESTEESAEESQDEPAEEPAEEPADEPEKPAADSGSGGGGSAEGTEVTLPALGESVTEGTVSRWLKSVGDSVEADEALLEVSTDKVDTEIPSPAAGTLLEIKVNEDETVDVGTVLAVIGDGSAADSAADEPEAAPEPEPEPEKKAEPEPEPEPEKKPAPKAEEKPAEKKPAEEKPAANGSADEGHGYVTPLVRKLASQHDVDLATISGTGVGGRIRKQDVLAAAEEAKKAAAAPAEAPAAAASAPAASTPAAEVSSLRGTTEKMSRLRKTIATRMVESLQVSAQLTTVVEVDLTAIARLRAKVKDDFARKEGVKLSYLPFLVKAAVEALKVHPKVNATIDTESGTISYPASENVSLAVDTEQGLLVPVIKDAGDLNIAGLARKIADLAERSRTKKLMPDDLAGGTFTVTNTGSRGALFDTPIINQPQVGILGTGAIVKRPVVLTDPEYGETIAVRDMMYLALSYDHRLVDGADAARFLGTIKERLEHGSFAAELGL